VGTLVANLTGTNGDVTTLVTPASAVVTDPPAGSCNLLTLDIGAIHLDLLGLVLDTNPIHLALTAQSGPGNLLGNLLCAVAGLLDGSGGAGTNQIANMLNQVLSAL
jgi:hypothetical protein